MFQTILRFIYFLEKKCLGFGWNAIEHKPVPTRILQKKCDKKKF